MTEKKKKGIPVEPELIEQVKQLYTQIERKGLGSRGIEIALDLINLPARTGNRPGPKHPRKWRNAGNTGFGASAPLYENPCRKSRRKGRD